MIQLAYKHLHSSDNVCFTAKYTENNYYNQTKYKTLQDKGKPRKGIHNINWLVVMEDVTCRLEVYFKKLKIFVRS